MNLRSAIIQFLANEFKFQPSQLTADISFTQDLGLTTPEVTDLLQRLQESLDFILPEDSLADISTVGQLLSISEPEEA
jgi:acyl carrier protein